MTTDPETLEALRQLECRCSELEQKNDVQRRELAKLNRRSTAHRDLLQKFREHVRRACRVPKQARLRRWCVSRWDAASDREE